MARLAMQGGVRMVLLLGMLAGVVQAAPAAGAGQDLNHWRFGVLGIPLLEAAPKLDGHLDDEFWQRATLLPPLMSTDPLAGDGVPPRERTWVWIAYTRDALYFAFRQDLPAYELPVLASIAERDRAEGRDNTVNLLFSTRPDDAWEQFNISGNGLGTLYDRRFDDGSNYYWNPAIDYRARLLPTGFEGEMCIPFAALDVAQTPAAGTQWSFNVFSAWRRNGTRLFCWPYARWRRKGENGRLLFTGQDLAVRFDDAGGLQLSGAAAPRVQMNNQLLHRPRVAGQAFHFPFLTNAVDVSQGEAATFASMDDMIKSALQGFTPAARLEPAGEYLLQYRALLGDVPVAQGVQAYYVAPPLELEVKPYWLRARQLEIIARASDARAATLKLDGVPAGVTAPATIPFTAGVAQVRMPTEHWPQGVTPLRGYALDAAGQTLAAVNVEVQQPAAPIWWEIAQQQDPLIPPPWTPIRATPQWAEILGRHYAIGAHALPTQVISFEQTLLADPIALHSEVNWQYPAAAALVSSAPDVAVYQSTLTSGELKLTIRNQLEFDGFMLLDLELAGRGTLQQLELEIPFVRRQAQLLQNYNLAPGPGKWTGRFSDVIPDTGYTSPPTITTWIGNERAGLELSCESSRGWALAKPNEAIRVQPVGDRTTLRVSLISKPVTIAADQPRRIRLGLVATPTKTILPALARARFYDDIKVALLPYDWAGFPAWHPPVTDAQQVAKVRSWVQSVHDAGQKLLVNGGWAVSMQDAASAPWTTEMFAQPLNNVSYSGAKHYAYCYNSPFAAFLAGSFAYNAAQLRFDGIRFDTVTPGYTCNSEIHGCGWRDDDGNLWPSYSFFSQREAWKRIYRAFHGGAVDDGVVYTPNAAGPIMAVHSFSDHHEIGEGFYQSAANLKVGYPPGMVRSLMTGSGYGFITGSNLKHGPLYPNERVAALLLHNAEPRFLDSRNWRAGYDAHALPAASIFDAWEWVDRQRSRFHGWWENADLLRVDAGDRFIRGSFWAAPDRVLLVVSSYETEPAVDLAVQFNYAHLGLLWPVYAEDAITGEPVALSRAGEMRLPVLGQRYRLLKISGDRPRFDAARLSDNLLSNTLGEAGAAGQWGERWTSPTFTVEPGSEYVVSAEIWIDQPLGAASKSPNVMGKFSPAVSHYVTLLLQGQDLVGINNSNRRSGPERYDQTDEYRRSFAPQAWESTGGWVRLFVPMRAGATAREAQAVLATSDPGQVKVRQVEVRKVLR